MTAVAVPSSVRTRLDEVRPNLAVARDYVKSKLSAELADFDPVVTQARVKSDESIYAKLQRGDQADLWQLDDLVAARVVFLHPEALAPALEVTSTQFPVLEARNVEVDKPTDFRYQQPHLITTLPADYLARHQELQELRVEIQFTTYVQHALQESTHDVIYKGRRFSWREHRLDARLRAILEIVDDVLENVATVAELGDDPPFPLFDNRNMLVETLRRRFGEDALPGDMRRLAITVETLVKEAKVSHEEFDALLEANDDLRSALSLTVADKVLGVLVRHNVDRFARPAKLKVAVPTELETLVPEALQIPPSRRVRLGEEPVVEEPVIEEPVIEEPVTEE